MTSSVKQQPGRILRPGTTITAWPDLERWLQSCSVSYQLIEVRLDRVDVVRSGRNQARIGEPVDQKIVDRYILGMKAHDAFPPIVVYREAESGRYIVIDGNHRVHAAIAANRETFHAFVVEGSPGVLTAMTFEANVRHGKAVDDNDRVHHAMWLVDNGMGLDEAAKRLNLSPKLLRKAKTEIDAMRRADIAGIPRTQWESLSASVRGRLYAISTDEGLVAAVALIHDAGLGTEDVFKLVGEVNDTRSAAMQTQVVQRWRDEYTDAIAERRVGNREGVKGVRNRTPKTAWASWMGLARTLPAGDILAGSLAPAERAEAADKLREVLKRVNEALGELERQ